jgi:DNA invertase Pin-like site-specific DNA recombinase
MGTVYGYARVSTGGQDLTLQNNLLVQAGCDRVFSETVSGAKAAAARPQLAKLLRLLGPGDTLVITRLDRLARSTLDLLHTVDQITKAGADFKSLADAWCDTATPHGKLMLSILASLAEFERSLILGTHPGRHQGGARAGRALWPAAAVHRQAEGAHRREACRRRVAVEPGAGVPLRPGDYRAGAGRGVRELQIMGDTVEPRRLDRRTAR